MATKDPNLKEPLELRLEVTSFLRGLAKNSEEEEKAPSPKPPVKELCKWVAWKAEACKTPGWWRELLAVPEVQDCEKLAWKVQASFQLPKRASELHKMENYHWAPPVPPVSLQKEFPATSQFHLCLPGHSRDAKGEDGGICPNPPVLGGEDWSASWREATPVSRQCEVAARGDGLLPLLLRWRGF